MEAYTWQTSVPHSEELSSPKFKRGASIGAFWILIGILAVQILQTYLVDGETQQSAYGNDWNDEIVQVRYQQYGH